MLAVRGDKELNWLLPSHQKGILGGGVIPHVHKSFVERQGMEDANLDGSSVSALVRHAEGMQPTSTLAL